MIGNYNNREQFWLISPEGDVLSLERHQAQEKASSDINFDDNSIDDIERFQIRYLGRGNTQTLNSILHSGFHLTTQLDSFNIENPLGLEYRYDRASYTSERLIRNLIQRYLVKALTNVDNIDYVLSVLSAFEYYKTNFGYEFAIASYFDRIEGSAQWFDWVASMSSLFDNEINSIKEQQETISNICYKFIIKYKYRKYYR